MRAGPSCLLVGVVGLGADANQFGAAGAGAQLADIVRILAQQAAILGNAANVIPDSADLLPADINLNCRGTAAAVAFTVAELAGKIAAPAVYFVSSLSARKHMNRRY